MFVLDTLRVFFLLLFLKTSPLTNFILTHGNVFKKANNVQSLNEVKLLTWGVYRRWKKKKTPFHIPHADKNYISSTDKDTIREQNPMGTHELTMA